MNAGSPSPTFAPSLASCSTIGVGGHATRFIRSSSPDALIADLQHAQSRNIPTMILGGGSNVVFADEGFNGWILQPTFETIHTHITPDEVHVTADAGVPWDVLVQHCVEQEYRGIEALSGIPGHVGAAPVQNIGAYGQELSDTLLSVVAYDRLQHRTVTLSHDDCEFGYRTSRFKREGQNAWVILSITLRLQKPNSPMPLRYAELQKRLGESDAHSAQAIRNAVLSIRRRKGMVVDSRDADSRSVGSFFMNPIVDPSVFARIQRRAQTLGCADLPHFPQPDGRTKLSAAWLIQWAGIPRGFWYRRARISTKHVLAITNPGRATAEDIRMLARYVQHRVHAVWGVYLVPEVRIMSPNALDKDFYLPPATLVS